MSGDFVEVSGITPSSHFPKCPPNHPCTQFCEIDKLFIPCPNPGIDAIREVCVNVIVCATKEICTPLGRKLVIDGKKQIKVNFTADDPCKSVHSAVFDIPFCAFILLGEIKHEVIQVCTAIEDITVKLLDCRCLTVTSIIFICPVFKKEASSFPHNQCECHEPCKPQNECFDTCNHHIPYENCCIGQGQSTQKKYQSGTKCTSCGSQHIMRSDHRYYYGK
ncbi:MAG: hypothetical protein H6Q72_3285 [Firmicutes bacterium]|nr:hypothetical protein [Bacillota bacterium]